MTNLEIAINAHAESEALISGQMETCKDPFEFLKLHRQLGGIIKSLAEAQKLDAGPMQKDYDVCFEKYKEARDALKKASYWSDAQKQHKKDQLVLEKELKERPTATIDDFRKLIEAIPQEDVGDLEVAENEYSTTELFHKVYYLVLDNEEDYPGLVQDFKHHIALFANKLLKEKGLMNENLEYR